MCGQKITGSESVRTRSRKAIGSAQGERPSSASARRKRTSRSPRQRRVDSSAQFDDVLLRGVSVEFTEGFVSAWDIGLEPHLAIES